MMSMSIAGSVASRPPHHPLQVRRIDVLVDTTE